MIMLKFTLLICAFAGFWQPSTWTSLFKHVIYKAYALFIMSALYTFSFTQCMEIIMNVEDSNELTDAMYMLLTVFVAGYKQVFMWVDHKNVLTIIDVLNEKPFTPAESHEVMIQQKFDKRIQNNTLRYLILVMSTVTIIIVGSIFTAFMARNLTYKAWIPFDYSAPVIFFFVYIYQLIGMSSSGIVNVASESLIFGLLLHICCQLEILEHRLAKITYDPDILRDCIRHHNHIFEYAYKVNNTFTKIITVQFVTSLLVVCSILYRLAISTDYMKFISLTFYMGCMLSQIFIYCWFGNEVKLKSLHLMDSIYNIKWPTLSDNNQKNLLIIMKRATIPIEFSSAYIITLNLDSFVALLKMSYSTFNLLHGTQEEK